MLTLDRPPIPMRVPVVTPFRPVHASRRIGQFVQVSPDVKVEAPISIELGGLPLTLGAFAGAGLAFLVRGGLKPGWGKTVATIVGAGLGVLGIVNVILPTAQATEAGVQPVSYTPAAAPAGGIASETPQPFVPSAEEAFAQVTGAITFPSNYTEVDIWPTAQSYPAEIQLQNGSAGTVTFSAVLKAREEPGPFGAMKESSLPVQVTLGPHQVQNIPIQMPIAAWEALADYVVIDLDLYKQRVAGAPMVRLDSNTFTIE